MIPIDKIRNTETCFIQLWLLITEARYELMEQHKRYCIRNIMKLWFGDHATDDFIWEVCIRCERLGLNELPSLTAEPALYFNLLCAVVGVVLNKGPRYINWKALTRAYRIAYPKGVPLLIDHSSLSPP